MGKKSLPEDSVKFAPIPLRLAVFRDARGWSQDRLGELLHVSGPTIHRIETGQQNWSQDFLQRAANLFDCDILDLLPPEPGSILEAILGLSGAERDRAIRLIAASRDDINAGAA